jgi:hypothetical protein
MTTDISALGKIRIWSKILFDLQKYGTTSAGRDIQQPK